MDTQTQKAGAAAAASSSTDSKSQTQAAGADGTSPVVLAQPTEDTWPFPTSADADSTGKAGNASSAGNDTQSESGGRKLTMEVVKGRLATAQEMAVGKYRDASATTNEFVRRSPWQSVAFAALGGVILGMLMSR